MLKFNIFYKSDLNEQWTLANAEPLPASGINEYTVTGLKSNVNYYFTIVAGVQSDSEDFVPYIEQSIGPTEYPITDIDSAQNMDIYQIKTLSFKSATNIIGNAFEVV